MNDFNTSTAQSIPLGESKTSGMAIASLVCGLFSLLFLPAIAAIVLGVISLNKIKKSAGALKGGGLAIAGIVLGGVYLVFVPILAALSAPAITKALERSLLNTEIHEMKMVGSTRSLYLMDNEEAPASLAALFTGGDEDLYDTLIQVDMKDASGTWVYFSEPNNLSPGETVILASPYLGEKRLILSVDGSVKALLSAEADVLLDTQTGQREEIPFQ